MKRTDKGSVVVYIILMSTSVFIILMALLNQASVIFSASQERYYLRLASEAAEAGTAYAESCLTIYDRVQSWGPGANGGARPNLTPSTDCLGSATTPSRDYVIETNTVRTAFSVGDLESSLNESALISSTGTAEKLKQDGSVAKSYSFTIKKNLTWPVTYDADRSANGAFHTCAVLSGLPYCWGYNRYGQLGSGEAVGSGDIETSSTTDSLVPVRVKREVGGLAGKYATEIFAAMHHSCALAGGEVYCWGWNEYGQLGNGSSGDYSALPVKVEGALSGKSVTAIGGTGNTSCAIAEGKIYCWGLNSLDWKSRGVVGVDDSSTAFFTTPQQVVAGNTSTTLSTSYTATKLTSTGSRSYVMCAIADDQAYCWGNNDRGAIGDDTTTDRFLPTKVYQESGVLLGKKVIDISQDGFNDNVGFLPHACVVATETDGSDGKVYCWGNNSHGQLGDGTQNNSLRPLAVRANSGDELFNKEVTDVAAGLLHTCVVADETPYCWGTGAEGQLGNNASADSSLPVAVSSLPSGIQGETISSVGGGSNRGCAVSIEGRVFCWGRNVEAQIGDGTTTNRFVPTESLYLRPQPTKYLF